MADGNIDFVLHIESFPFPFIQPHPALPCVASHDHVLPCLLLLNPNTNRPSPLPPLQPLPSPPRRHRHRRRRTPIQRFPPPHNLIAFVQLDLHRATDLQRTHSGPHTPLAMQDPILDTLLSGGFE